MSNLPTKEDIARADSKMRERERGLDTVEGNLSKRFQGRGGFHKIFVMWQKDVDFRAYVFFRLDKDAETARESGLLDEIEDAFLEELEKVDRARRGETKVALEIDSHENVERNYRSSYFLRMR